jgi:CMP-N,N'-diacetyllegionaminic acid synthase
MYDGYSLLAVIPARSGSKGLPNKNIIDCTGRPLIEWSISAAKNVNFIDEVLVSTDSEEISDVARRAGASVPFLRPSKFAADDSSLLDVVSHAWRNHLSSNGGYFDYVVLLQPTSPLRTSAHLSAAIKLYFESRQSDEDTLASVFRVNPKIGWLMQVEDYSGYINFCFDVSSKNPQRQKLKPYYLPNGAIFIVKGGMLIDGLYRKNTIPFVMDASDSIDIDTADDLKDADTLLAARLNMIE